MGWADYLLGVPTDWVFKCNDNEPSIQRIRASLNSATGIDLDQDRQIEALWRENVNLKMCIGSLVNLLVAKHLITGEELTELVAMLDKAEQADPIEAEPVPAEPDSSPELQRIQDAIATTAGQPPAHSTPEPRNARPNEPRPRRQ